MKVQTSLTINIDYLSFYNVLSSLHALYLLKNRLFLFYYMTELLIKFVLVDRIKRWLYKSLLEADLSSGTNADKTNICIFWLSENEIKNNSYWMTVEIYPKAHVYTVGFVQYFFS